jgi:hypothetical protein
MNGPQHFRQAEKLGAGCTTYPGPVIKEGEGG